MMRLFAKAAFAMALTLAASSPAQAEPSFTAEKICGLTRAPDGFRQVDVFIQAKPYYEPIFDVYQDEGQDAGHDTLLVSNINGGCWLKLAFAYGFNIVAQTTPTDAGGPLDMDLQSRRLANDLFLNEIDVCNEDQDGYIRSLYYAKELFRQFPENPKSDVNYCYIALSFGSISLIVESGGARVYIDIISGTSFIGETE